MRATRASDDRLARHVWGRRMPAESGKFAIGASVEQACMGGQQGLGPGWRMGRRRMQGRQKGSGGGKGGRAPGHRRWRSGRERQRVRGGRERERARKPESERKREGYGGTRRAQ